MIVGFLAPAVIIFLIVFLYPIIRTIMMSMYKIESVTDTMEWWTFVGLGNYQKLFTTAIFKTAMMNILKIWALGGIIVLSVSLLFGVILTSGIRGKKFFRAIIYLPNIVSAVALATMWLQYVYSSKFGLLKGVLDSLGLHKLAKTPWLDSDHKFWALHFCILLRNDWISYVDLDERNSKESAQIFLRRQQLTVRINRSSSAI